MKTRHLAFILLLLGMVLGVVSCRPHMPSDKYDLLFHEGKNHLLMMHPTVQNIERIIFLTETGVFPLPENYRIIGVYHQDAGYDYSRSSEFILQEGLSDIVLYGAEHPLDIQSLYRENELTGIFGELFARSDGAVFLGGPDIPPAAYGEEHHLLTVVTDPYRHYLELSFLFHLIGGSQDTTFVPLLEKDPGYAILGICLGLQTMNVASGGSLIQDIPTEVYGTCTVEEVVSLDPEKQHRNYYSYYRLDPGVSTASYHRITIDSPSHMAVIAGDTAIQPFVLSAHHQAIRTMGIGFRATAWSTDGKIVEAIEHKTYPNVIGIQFHPEVPYLYDPDHTLTFHPDAEGDKSYLDLYPGALGADFHRSFWVHFAGMLP